MRFEGRVSAGIEILETLLSEALPPDRLLTAYFKRRRYAGAKDRRAIAERLYGMLRDHGHLQWQAGSFRESTDSNGGTTGREWLFGRDIANYW